MELFFKNPGFDHSIESIMRFFDENQDKKWQEPIFMFYPEIDKNHFESLKGKEQKSYLSETLTEIYSQEESAINEKLLKYNLHWQKNKESVEDAFSDAFQLDCRKNFGNMQGNITLNPICPRFLDSHSFDVFYKNSERGALGIALHEIVHFVWFDVWQNHFKDDPTEYENPHLKWVFSEMAVDPIMRKDSRLSSINPYFPDGCAYKCFYHMSIEGTPILNTLYKFYENSNSDILRFMEEGFAYCRKYESEILAKMY